MAGTRPINLVLRLFVAVVFLVSGALKLWDPSRFLLDVLSFQLFPYKTAYLIALTLPWLEVLCALALLVRCCRRGAIALLAVLTVSFIALLITAEARGIHTDCGCFGDWLVFPNMGIHVAFNVVLLGALLWLGLRRSRPV
ncbi:MAG: MauE/DoxX family redox-associated membrane protein [Verrucomicrobiota bacterium JB022]|nr:MauE/DoxX family redox-associated membrane protein [Verrucomicrobiota bacterium JB022]